MLFFSLSAVEAIYGDYALTPVSQSRDIIGYTTPSCGHRLTSSKNGGMGFCSLPGLLEVAQVHHRYWVEREREREGEGERKREKERGRRGWRDRSILVLIRGESLHHRFAKFDILNHN